MSGAASPGLIVGLPVGWSAGEETAEGQVVRVFRPPSPLPGVLRLLTDRIAVDPPGDGAAATIKMREVALRFVRPDDSRAGDRLIEDGPRGGIVASAVMATENDDGYAEAHYLWLRAEPIDGEAAIRVAMAALALPSDRDGSPDAVEVVTAADVMFSAAVFSDAGA